MKQRVITGVIAGAAFLILLYFGQLPFTVLICLLAGVGFYEFATMHRFKLNSVAWIIGLIGTLYVVFPWKSFTEMTTLSFEASVWLALLLLLALTVLSKNKINFEKIAVIFAGIIYIGIGFHYMIVTRLLEDGLFWSLLIFICIWMTDIGAYFTGWAIGKRLLWPAISPKKTIEGAIGAIFITTAAAIVFSLFVPDLLSIDKAIVFGVAVSIVAQLGDFIQSAYKRACGVKDSGTLFPGHGGVLDRCDSWIIVFPFVHLLSLLPF